MCHVWTFDFFIFCILFLGYSWLDYANAIWQWKCKHCLTIFHFAAWISHKYTYLHPIYVLKRLLPPLTDICMYASPPPKAPNLSVLEGGGREATSHSIWYHWLLPVPLRLPVGQGQNRPPPTPPLTQPVLFTSYPYTQVFVRQGGDVHKIHQTGYCVDTINHMTSVLPFRGKM